MNTAGYLPVAPIPLPSSADVGVVAARYKWALILSFLLPVLASIGLGYALTPKYESEARLLVRAGWEYLPRREGAEAAQNSPSTSMRETVDTEVQILTSQDLIREVVEAVGITRLYPAQSEAPPVGVSPLRAAIDRFSRDLSVSAVKLTNVIELRLRNPSRPMAEEAMQAILDHFREFHLRAFSFNRSGVLERQVREREAQLAALQQERVEYQSQHGLYAVSEQRADLVAQRARDLHALRELERRKAAIEAQVLYVSSELARQPATMTAQSTNAPSIGAADTEKRVRDLEQRRQELMARGYMPSNPVLAGATAELNTARDALRQAKGRDVAVTTVANPLVANLKSQLLTLGMELAPLASTHDALQAAVKADDDELQGLIRDEVASHDYDHRITDLDATTTLLRQRLADARYVEEFNHAQFASVQVVQSPAASKTPVWPQKRLIGAGGVLVGLFGAAFTLLIALTFGNRCLTATGVERLLGVPVLATIGQVRPSRNQEMRPLPMPKPEDRVRDLA
jgi:uncharacterized protein involved in exopolysaccharide biosynthesis